MAIKFTEPKESWLYRRGLGFLLPLYIVTAILYIAWRFNNAALWDTWYAYPLWAIEAYSIIFTISHLFTTRKILHPVWQPPIKDTS